MCKYALKLKIIQLNDKKNCKIKVLSMNYLWHKTNHVHGKDCIRSHKTICNLHSNPGLQY